ncbi:MAG: eukaryotic-like serine/threonine-protein kinase [Actinomycetota bacterium]
MTPDATIVTGRRVADRYRLVSERPDGSWDAVDETLKRNVVVCLLSAQAQPDDKEQFTAEARALAGLNHRNVVATFDTGVDGDGTSYRVDELPIGHPLDPGAVPNDQRVSYATQIARAIADAHGRDLVHGSLTSGNVLVNDDGRVRVRGLRLPKSGTGDELKRADVDAVTNLIAALAPSSPSPLREMALGWRGSDPPSSAAAIVSALLTIPDDGDTVALVDPEPTPSTGVPAQRRRIPWTAIAAVVVLAAAAAAITMLLPGTKGGNVSGPQRALPVKAKSFDPEGSPPTENEAAAHFAVDGDPSTMWSTQIYRSAHFGNLKKGLGLILQADAPSQFDSLRIITPSTGWTFEIYAAEQPAAALSGWGSPVARGTATRDLTVDLGGAKGGALLVWITDPAGNQVRIAELDVTGRA